MNLDRRRLLAGAALLPALPWIARRSAARPNVVFVLVDQHNTRALGCEGHPVVRTPVLDELAAAGRRYPAAFCTTPQCDPARLSIQTGRYARSHGVVLNRVPYQGRDEFLPEAFRAAGYRTFCVGKRPSVAHPTRFGFERWENVVQYRRRHGVSGWSPTKEGELPVSLMGPIGPSRKANAEHPTGFWTDRAIEFVRESGRRPFLLWLSYYGPHTPIVPSPEFAELYDAESLELPPNFATEGVPAALAELRARQADFTPAIHRAVLAHYFGLVTQIDHNVGRLLGALEGAGVAENTIVVYVSDHGELMAEHGAWTKAPVLYDALVRVPLIVRFPARVEPGSVDAALTSTLDLKPGLLDLAGLRPRPSAPAGEGRSPFAEAPERGEVFAEFGDPRAERDHCLMVRTRTMKLVRHTTPEGPALEAFDLEDDPWETRNLAARRAEEFAPLRERLERFEREVPYARTAPIERPPGRRERRHGANEDED